MAAVPTTIALWSSGLASSSVICSGVPKALAFYALDQEVEPGLSFGDVKPEPVRSEEFLAVLAHERAEQRV